MNKSVILNSLGSAGFQIVDALKNAMPLSEERISRMVFQCPSVIFQDIPDETAKEVAKLLNSLGAETEVSTTVENIEKGDAQHEVALKIDDFSQMTKVLEQLMKWLHCSFEEARQIVNLSPQPFLGNISKNTANTLSDQFSGIGARVLISDKEAATYDLFLSKPDRFIRNNIIQNLRNKRISLTDKLQDEDSPILLKDLTFTEAEKIWSELGTYNTHCVVVNRDFTLFDIELTKISLNEQLTKILTEVFGLPQKVIPLLEENLPIVLKQDISALELPHHVNQLVENGAEVEAHLSYFDRWNIEIENIHKVEETATVLATILGQNKNSLVQKISGKREYKLPEALGRTTAKWIQFELQRLGVKVKLLQQK